MSLDEPKRVVHNVGQLVCSNRDDSFSVLSLLSQILNLEVTVSM